MMCDTMELLRLRVPSSKGVECFTKKSNKNPPRLKTSSSLFTQLQFAKEDLPDSPYRTKPEVSIVKYKNFTSVSKRNCYSWDLETTGFLLFSVHRN